MFDQGTALCGILYKRLRNALTYLLTYLEVDDNDDDYTLVRTQNLAAWKHPVRTRDCWTWWSRWWILVRWACPQRPTVTDWTDLR